MIRTALEYKLPEIKYPTECGSKFTFYLEPYEIRSFTKYSYDSNSLVISPGFPFMIGSYTVQILLDNQMGVNASYKFNLDVYDQPRFKEKLTLIEVEIGKKIEVKLPLIEEFGPMKVVHNQDLPSFIKFRYPSYQINPVVKENIGTFLINGIVYNKYNSTQFLLKIRVINNPPRFIAELPSLVETYNYLPKYLILPRVRDDQLHPWNMRAYDTMKKYLPSFIVLKDG